MPNRLSLLSLFLIPASLSFMPLAHAGIFGIESTNTSLSGFGTGTTTATSTGGFTEKQMKAITKKQASFEKKITNKTSELEALDEKIAALEEKIAAAKSDDEEVADEDATGVEADDKKPVSTTTIKKLKEKLASLKDKRKALKKEIAKLQKASDALDEVVANNSANSNSAAGSTAAGTTPTAAQPTAMTPEQMAMGMLQNALQNALNPNANNTVANNTTPVSTNNNTTTPANTTATPVTPVKTAAQLAAEKAAQERALLCAPPAESETKADPSVDAKSANAASAASSANADPKATNAQSAADKAAAEAKAKLCSGADVSSSTPQSDGKDIAGVNQTPGDGTAPNKYGITSIEEFKAFVESRGGKCDQAGLRCEIGGQVVGKNAQCASFPRTEIPYGTPTWREGPAVDENTKIGTWVATFNNGDKYGTDASPEGASKYSHTGMYLGRTADGSIILGDQFKNGQLNIRTYSCNGGNEGCDKYHEIRTPSSAWLDKIPFLKHIWVALGLPSIGVEAMDIENILNS